MLIGILVLMGTSYCGRKSTANLPSLGIPDPTLTHMPEGTTPSPFFAPTETPTITSTPTETPNVEATAQEQFEAKKAEALKMVSIKLDSPEDFATLPVLDDVADFDSGKVQEAEHWLIDNVLPPSDTKLPASWRIADGGNGYYWMSYNQISEANVNFYRFVDTFFVMQDGVKMLRIGLEVGGKNQLIHLNFQNPWWWTNSKGMDALISVLHHKDWRLELVVNYGSNLALDEPYTLQITSERFANGYQFFKDWVKYRQLPPDADKTIIGVEFIQ